MTLDSISGKWMWRSYWLVFLLLHLVMMYRRHVLNQLQSEYFDLQALSFVMLIIGMVNLLATPSGKPKQNSRSLWLVIVGFLAIALIGTLM